MTDDNEKYLPSWDNAEMRRTEAKSDDDHFVYGHCDCCNQRRELTQCWPGGLETWACDECRRIDDNA